MWSLLTSRKLFSALADLSDYLAPSQICIKPVTLIEDDTPGTSTPITSVSTPSIAPKTEIIIDAEQGYFEVGSGDGSEKKKKLKKAEITLNDCLACSGCITSAESVLVSMQSHEEVYRVLEEQRNLTPILSIAPQSIASLAALHSLTPNETFRGLRAFFKLHLGFRLVFDTTFSRTLSLDTSHKEYIKRRNGVAQNPSSRTTSLPILSSSCPGWICYAEKTHGELLPFVSKAKSAQAVMGVLVKQGIVGARLEKRPEEIYHVTVMPCYDKKLEASRPDFTTSIPSSDNPLSKIEVRDVDCVLTTGEVQRMLDDKSLSLSQLAQESTDRGDDEEQYFPSGLSVAGTSSGGYLFRTVQAVLEELKAQDEEAIYRTKVVEKKVRNSDDYIEIAVVSDPPTPATPTTPSPPPTTHLRALKCYGFRNLQNVVRKVSKDAGISLSRGGAAGKLPAAASAALARRKARLAASSGVEDSYDFVEVMACPGGCVNGGGQIAPPSAVNPSPVEGLTFDKEGMVDFSRMGDEEVKLLVGRDGEGKVLNPKEWVAKVERVYWTYGVVPEDSDVAVGRLDWSRMDPSVRPYLEGIEKERTLNGLRNLVVRQLLEGFSGEKQRAIRQAELFETEYRAVESEEVNGLAVKW
ncbi:iron hydrogenase [Meredithblackwellia eburnea MCA 4105]